MASWLKAAEDLFEVVDRKAKLAVGEKSDELSSSPLPASSNGQVSKTKRARLKAKAKRRMLTGETPQEVQTPLEEKTSDMPQLAVEPDKDTNVLPVENKEISHSNSTVQIRNEEPSNVEKEGSSLDTPLSESISVEEVQHDAISEEPQPAILNKETIATTPTVNHTDKDSSGILDEASTSPLASKGFDVIHQGPPINLDQDIRTADASTPTKVEEQGSTFNEVSTNSKVDILSKQADLKVDPVPNENKQDLKASKVDTSSKQADLKVDSVPNENKRDLKANFSSTKVQEQLDEAQGLLQVAISTGQSKEARLARVCAGLSTRLQEYKSENAQLEELLTAERELSKSCELRIKQLQKDLFTSKGELAKVESSMAEALAAKNSEIELLVSSMDGLKKQAALSEGNLASLQANMESIIRNRELTETRMMQALREELASAERRAEEERAAHNATKMAAMEREVELEHRAMDTSTALARIQRTADERTAKAAELEQKVALLEVECASLSQELQDMEARARRGQKKSPEEANQIIQIQAWQEEVERARLGQRDAESKLSSVEAELQKMRVEMASMKRDAEHYSRQEHMELEKRYRELTDLLYYKQTQLETMASEKAAAEFQLEKEMKRLQEAQVEAERSRFSRRGSSSWEEDTDIKALEPLPLYHRHMVGASMQLQKAAKLLDSGAVRATRFLWRYPTARIMLLFYLVFVHLFLMYLLHRLQEQADTFSSREVAESMGLANGTLP